MENAFRVQPLTILLTIIMLKLSYKINNNKTHHVNFLRINGNTKINYLDMEYKQE